MYVRAISSRRAAQTLSFFFFFLICFSTHAAIRQLKRYAGQFAGSCALCFLFKALKFLLLRI